jgi:hypothetical protein
MPSPTMHNLRYGNLLRFGLAAKGISDGIIGSNLLFFFAIKSIRQINPRLREVA